MKSNKISCLFGFHKYTIPFTGFPGVLICEVCQRHAYEKHYNSHYLIEKDVIIRLHTRQDGTKEEHIFTRDGKLIASKRGRTKSWLSNDGTYYVNIKPENWKWEKLSSQF